MGFKELKSGPGWTQGTSLPMTHHRPGLRRPQANTAALPTTTQAQASPAQKRAYAPTAASARRRDVSRLALLEMVPKGFHRRRADVNGNPAGEHTCVLQPWVG